MLISVEHVLKSWIFILVALPMGASSDATRFLTRYARFGFDSLNDEAQWGRG